MSIFQEDMVRFVLGPVHPRRTLWIFDELGATGKSALIKWLAHHYPNLVEVITAEKAWDITFVAGAKPNKKAYIINLSTAMSAPRENTHTKTLHSWQRPAPRTSGRATSTMPLSSSRTGFLL